MIGCGSILDEMILQMNQDDLHKPFTNLMVIADEMQHIVDSDV